VGATNAVELNEPAHHPTHRKPTTGGGFSLGTRVGGGSEAKSAFVDSGWVGQAPHGIGAIRLAWDNNAALVRRHAAVRWASARKHNKIRSGTSGSAG
jgi:hypothetical protein